MKAEEYFKANVIWNGSKVVNNVQMMEDYHKYCLSFEATNDLVFNVTRRESKKLTHDSHSAHELMALGAKAVLKELKAK